MELYIVEDSALMRGHLIETMCGMEGVTIAGIAGTSKHAIEFLSRKCPEVITLDISLHDGTGIEVLSFIKKKCPETVVVVLTNYAYPQYREMCSRFGADYFFDKTKEYESFVSLLEELRNSFDDHQVIST